MTAKFPFTSVTSQKTNFNLTPHKPSRIRVPAARCEAVCVIRSRHAPPRQSNLQNRRGCRNSESLLSGTGEAPRSAPYPRKQISPCGTVDWRCGRAARSFASFVTFLSNKEKLTVPPLQRDSNRSVGEKAKRSLFPRRVCNHGLGESSIGQRHPARSAKSRQDVSPQRTA